MQPTSPVPLVLAFQTLPGSTANPEAVGTASTQRLEERPQSALAQGSYAWPAWAVIGVALFAALCALAWWLRLQRHRGGNDTTGATEPAAAERARS